MFNRPKYINYIFISGMIFSPMVYLFKQNNEGILLSIFVFLASLVSLLFVLVNVSEEKKFIKNGKKAVAKYHSMETIDQKKERIKITVTFTDDSGEKRFGYTKYMKNYSIDIYDLKARTFNIAYNDEEEYILILNIIDNTYDVECLVTGNFNKYEINKCSLVLSFKDKTNRNKTAQTDFIFSVNQAEELYNKKVLAHYDEDTQEIKILKLLQD